MFIRHKSQDVLRAAAVLAGLCAGDLCVYQFLCRYGKARIFVDGVELYTKRYTLLQQARRLFSCHLFAGGLL